MNVIKHPQKKENIWKIVWPNVKKSTTWKYSFVHILHKWVLFCLLKLFCFTLFISVSCNNLIIGIDVDCALLFFIFSGFIWINLAHNKKIDLLILVKKKISNYYAYSFFLSFISVSCNNLIIAIGLCIDYASHIAHRFLIEPGPDRNSRIRSTLENIGPVGYGLSNS